MKMYSQFSGGVDAELVGSIGPDNNTNARSNKSSVAMGRMGTKLEKIVVGYSLLNGLLDFVVHVGAVPGHSFNTKMSY